jgi:hypothetical protein
VSKASDPHFDEHRGKTIPDDKCGLTKCGVCGAGFIVYSREHLGCFGARGRGTRDNRLTIPRQEVETRVLRALQDKLMRKDFFEEFCREFAKEMNRLRMEQRAGLSSAKREVERIGRRIKKLLDLMLDDQIAVEEGKAEMNALDSRRKELEAQLKSTDEPPPLLYPWPTSTAARSKNSPPRSSARTRASKPQKCSVG